jgi:CheY-like chemotaxis protein
VAVILIVEDDVFIRELAEMSVRDWGHHILLASDVDEALLILRSPNTSTHFLLIFISRNGSWVGVNLHTRLSSFGHNCVFSTRLAISLPTKLKLCLLKARDFFASHTRHFSSKILLNTSSQPSFEVAASVRKVGRVQVTGAHHD